MTRNNVAEQKKKETGIGLTPDPPFFARGWG